MNKPYSIAACFLISIVLLQQRIAYIPAKPKQLNITTYDALGYYMYLPGIFIYHDITELKWFPGIDSQYHVSGGWFYQANKQENGKYVFKYLGGVALLQIPLFYTGHIISKVCHYKSDGFSPPYQYALAFGILFYCLLSILLLLKILLLYFTDAVTAISLLLLLLASNFIQYAAVDSAMSHAYIFPLYIIVLYATIKWHQQPKLVWAGLIGYVIGLATICRPTELIMFLIPLLWSTHNKEMKKQKWTQVKNNKSHIAFALVFSFIGILPQLIYWKYVTGSFVYDVGSKWDFLSPHFRVLFGWEKGWFIYTPVTILFLLGLFFSKRYDFNKSVIWFCLLNIYIIIAWNDWRYGASYSARALVQSYPIFSLPLGALVTKVYKRKWKIYLTLVIGIYLVAVNIFQIWQYNKTILHYNDMNRQYYSHIYLEQYPTSEDMSLLDSNMAIDECEFNTRIIYSNNTLLSIAYNSNDTFLTIPIQQSTKDKWVKMEVWIQMFTGYYDTYLSAILVDNKTVGKAAVRINNPISKEGIYNRYAFYIHLPISRQPKLKLFLVGSSKWQANIRLIQLTALSK